MDERSRRGLLAGLAGVTALSGCNGTSTPTNAGEPTATPTETSTETPVETLTETASETSTSTPVSASELEFGGGVVRQPNESGPGRIRAWLTNHADWTIRVIGGDPLPVSATTDDGPNDALMLYPDPTDVINDFHWENAESEGLNAATYEDCWRAPSTLVGTDLATGADIPQGLSIAAEYTPLAMPGADCPEGTYTAVEELTLRGNDQTLVLEFDVHIDGQSRLGVDGRLTLESRLRHPRTHDTTV